MAEFTEILKEVGDKASLLGEKFLKLIPPELLTSPSTAKIFSILFYAILIWVVLHFLTSIKPIVKYAIIGLLVLLIVSVGLTFTS